MKDWEKCNILAKKALGMARFNDYCRGCSGPMILSTHAGSRMRPETRAKLEALARSGDPEMRKLSQETLATILTSEETEEEIEE